MYREYEYRVYTRKYSTILEYYLHESRYGSHESYFVLGRLVFHFIRDDLSPLFLLFPSHAIRPHFSRSLLHPILSSLFLLFPSHALRPHFSFYPFHRHLSPPSLLLLSLRDQGTAKYKPLFTTKHLPKIQVYRLLLTT